VREAFTAVRALERLFARMDSDVFLRNKRTEYKIADLITAPLSVMAALTYLKVMLKLEGLVALRAFEFP